MLLKRIMGEEWWSANLVPSEGDLASFIRRDLKDAKDASLHVLRVIQLAESLYCLRQIPGLSQRLEQSKGKTVASMWFELFVPYLILRGGHKVLEFIPEDKNRHTADVLAELHDQRIPVEIKAKQEESQYSRRNLLYLMRDGFRQLPKAGPGIVFLMIHEHWLRNELFLREAEAAINQTLRRHRNCNAVFVQWPVNETLSAGGFLASWRFQHFLNWHPMYPVYRITNLIAHAESLPNMLEVSFMADSS